MEKIILEKAEVFLLKKDLIKIQIKKEVFLEIEDMQEINAAKDKFAGDNKHCVLFVTGNFGNISNDAMKFSANKKVFRNAVAKAIVINSLASRLIGNFFIRFYKPPAPVKLFPDEDKATEWLTSMLKNNN